MVSLAPPDGTLVTRHPIGSPAETRQAVDGHGSQRGGDRTARQGLAWLVAGLKTTD